MEEKIWQYIDGTLHGPDRELVKELVEKNAEWKKIYGQLLEINALLQSSELETPSLRFTKNVMEEIARTQIAPATRSYINKRIIWGIGFFFIVMLAGILVYSIGQLGSGGGGESDFTKNLDRIDFSKLFSNTWVNIFIMANIVIGLFLFDQYLTIKKKKFRQEA
jgi:hypothetical protein